MNVSTQQAMERLVHVQHYLDWTRLALTQCVNLDAPDERLRKAQALLEEVARLVVDVHGSYVKQDDQAHD
jgi:hypothetical protein